MVLHFSKIQNIAKKFWQDSGQVLQYPLQLIALEQGILLGYPVSLVKVSGLTLVKIANYLKDRSIDLNYGLNDSPLFGFIISQNGYTYIFLNGLESAQQQCFTLAHEFGHYLFDYYLPQQELMDKYGATVADALANKRPFTMEERVKALLAGQILKPFTHLLDTAVESALNNIDIWRAEANADLFALELIAPFELIKCDIRQAGIVNKYNDLYPYIQTQLQEKYALPVMVAGSYSKLLAEKISGGISLSEKWGIKNKV